MLARLASGYDRRMAGQLLRWLAAAVALAGTAYTGVRVRALERGELDHETQWRSLEQLATATGSTAISAQLADVTLRAGEHVVFELCARDRMEAPHWIGAFELAVIQPPQQLMLRVPLDAPHLQAAKRAASSACLPLGGGRIERDGRYVLHAVWQARPPPASVRGVALQARVLARTPLGPLDRAAVVAVGMALLVLLVSLGSAAPAPGRGHGQGELGSPSWRHWPLWIHATLGLATLWAAMQWAPQAPSLTVLKGIGLVALQLGLAWSLARRCAPRSIRAALAAHAPRPLRAMFTLRIALHYPLWIGIAAVTGVLLVVQARIDFALVPSSGEAPIQTFIGWPSGMLCFALLGMLLPLGEEVFFRGALFRTLLPLGPGVAVTLTSLAFVALHAEQSWGHWAGLLAIAASGLAFATLRAISGSLLVPALAHLLYNLALSIRTLYP